jgi:hydrogenase-4 membrane subunit HyfE
MTGPLAWLLVLLALGVVVVRRRSVAVALVTTQALALAGIALSQATTRGDVVAALALVLRGLALGALFLLVVSRSRETAPVRARLSPVVRAWMAVAVILCVSGLVPALGLASRTAERAVLALVAAGLVCSATRRATLFQVLGIVLVENGLGLAALEFPRASSLVIELGVTDDLTLLVCVATLFHLRIYSEFGAGDSAALRSLRDV